MNEMKGLPDIVKQAFMIESEALAMQKPVLYEAIADAAQLLVDSSVIAASACGHTGISCMHFAHLMCCIGKSAKFVPPSEAIHGGLGFMQPGSVMLLASRGGKTAELVPIQSYCIEHGIKIIAVTENLESNLAKKSDIILPILVNRETDRYNCQGTTSFAVTSAVFDALQAAMIELMDFRNESFAQVHPGGAVGERLNGGK